MLEWYRQLLELRRKYVIHGQRTADAQYIDGVLTMEVPAKNSQLVVEASLQPGAVLRPVKSGWHEVLRSAEDGYEVSVFVR